MCWDLSNTLSAVGILASVVVALYIYYGWNLQKQKEVVASDAGILLENIESLRKNVIEAHEKGTVDDFFICSMKEKRGEIEFILLMINEINKSLIYEQYINSLSELITTLQADPNSIGEKGTARSFLIRTVDLGNKLRKLRLYIWK